MSRTVHEFTAKQIIYETSLPITEVTARLDQELSRDKTGPKLLEKLGTVKTKEELEQGIHQMNGGKDFLLFGAAAFHNWRNAYYEQDTPKTIQYTIGNPLIAETMIQHEIATALQVPFRVLVAEKPNRSGTQLIYVQPSSVIVVPVDGKVNEELKAAAEALDKKVERLIQKVTKV